MHDWLDLGPSPPDEECAQVGQEGYYDQARRECRAYIGMLRRTLGAEPTGARLGIKSNPHDFGSYLSVVCYCEPGNQEAVEYALRCESDCPLEWDDVARQELSIRARRDNNAVE